MTAKILQNCFQTSRQLDLFLVVSDCHTKHLKSVFFSLLLLNTCFYCIKFKTTPTTNLKVVL